MILAPDISPTETSTGSNPSSSSAKKSPAAQDTTDDFRPPDNTVETEEQC
jgi:hypothetical protein